MLALKGGNALRKAYFPATRFLSLGACRLYCEPILICNVRGPRCERNGPRSGKCLRAAQVCEPRTRSATGLRRFVNLS